MILLDIFKGYILIENIHSISMSTCRPHMGLGFHAACFAKCHSPIGPCVASWLVVIESDSGIEERVRV